MLAQSVAGQHPQISRGRLRQALDHRLVETQLAIGQPVAKERRPDASNASCAFQWNERIVRCRRMKSLKFAKDMGASLP